LDRSHFHDLGFLLLAEFTNFFDEFIGHFLQIFFAALEVILRN